MLEEVEMKQGEITNKPGFIKEKGEIYLRDRNGKYWSEECVIDMVETIIRQSKLMKTIAYYNSERSDGEDYYEEGY